MKHSRVFDLLLTLTQKLTLKVQNRLFDFVKSESSHGGALLTLFPPTTDPCRNLLETQTGLQLFLMT